MHNICIMSYFTQNVILYTKCHTLHKMSYFTQNVILYTKCHNAGTNKKYKTRQ